MQAPRRARASGSRAPKGGALPAGQQAVGAREEAGAERNPLAEAFQTLGSDARLRILKELLRGERAIAELAAAVGLQPVTVRYHLTVLLRDGLRGETPGPRGG